MNSYSQMELLVDYIISERLAEAERERQVFQVPRAGPRSRVGSCARLIASSLRTSANLFRRSAPCQRSGAH